MQMINTKLSNIVLETVSELQERNTVQNPFNRHSYNETSLENEQNTLITISNEIQCQFQIYLPN
jgi:hypothetical protein